MKRYLIFHVVLLELVHDDIPMEESIMVEPEEDIWDAEKILNSINDDGKVKYLVKWKNFEHTENTWEPIEHLMGSQQLLAVFHWKNLGRLKDLSLQNYPLNLRRTNRWDQKP